MSTPNITPNPQGQSQWDPLPEFRQRYPGVKDPDDVVLSKLADPGKFRSAFPEYSQADDATIRQNIGKLRLSRGVGTTMSQAGRSPEEVQQILSDRSYQESGPGGRLVTSFRHSVSPTDNPADIVQGPKYAMAHPVDAAKLTYNAATDAQQSLIDKAYGEYHTPGIGHKAAGLAYGLYSMLPGGSAMAHAGEQMSEGDWAGGLGTTMGVAAPMALAPEVRSNVAGAARGTVNAVRNAPSAVKNVMANKPALAKAALRLVPGGKTLTRAMDAHGLLNDMLGDTKGGEGNVPADPNLMTANENNVLPGHPNATIEPAQAGMRDPGMVSGEDKLANDMEATKQRVPLWKREGVANQAPPPSVPADVGDIPYHEFAGYMDDQLPPPDINEMLGTMRNPSNPLGIRRAGGQLLDTSSLTPSEPGQDMFKVDDYANRSTTPPPIDVYNIKHEGQQYRVIGNGHHRSLAAQDRGGYVPANIYDIPSTGMEPPTGKSLLNDILDDYNVRQQIEQRSATQNSPTTSTWAPSPPKSFEGPARLTGHPGPPPMGATDRLVQDMTNEEGRRANPKPPTDPGPAFNPPAIGGLQNKIRLASPEVRNQMTEQWINEHPVSGGMTPENQAVERILRSDRRWDGTDQGRPPSRQVIIEEAERVGGKTLKDVLKILGERPK